MSESQEGFDPTEEGILVLITSVFIIGFALFTYSFQTTEFNIAVTVGLVGVAAGLFDILGYIDMGDILDALDEKSDSDGVLTGNSGSSNRSSNSKSSNKGTTNNESSSGKSNSNGSSDSESSSANKTPPVPQKKKNELYYERAETECEHCEEQVDQPHVHHIEPRSEGGPNTDDNLIVLCPNCHSKADSGLLAKHRLKYRVREQNKKLEEET